MPDRAFTAALLRASADGFAGLAASRLIVRAPKEAGPAGFEGWRDHLRARLGELAAAVDDGAPELFAARIGWSRDAFVARELPPEALAMALESLREVLEELLPGEAWTALPPFFESARAELERAPAPPPPAMGEQGLDRTAQDYVERLLDGDERGAQALVLDAVRAGRVSVPGAIETVLVPAQREIGRRWHRGEIDVADEHFASGVARKLLVHLTGLVPAPSANGRTAVLAAVAGDAHDLGVLFVAAFLELDGWRTITAGADTPIEDLVQLSERYDADLVALGATLDAQREVAARTVAALRSVRPRQVVLVGGAAFAGPAELWKRVGADACASSPREAVRLAHELLQG